MGVDIADNTIKFERSTLIFTTYTNWNFHAVIFFFNHQKIYWIFIFASNASKFIAVIGVGITDYTIKCERYTSIFTNGIKNNISSALESFSKTSTFIFWLLFSFDLFAF